MYKVIKKFRDKYRPSRVYEVGETVDFTEERAEEILKVDKFIKKIEEIKVEKPKKSRKKTDK